MTLFQLSAVGVYMPGLASLDISYCHQVSDSGLLTLFASQDTSGKEDQRYGQCKKLSRLLVSGSQNITGKSISQALLRLPLLAICDFPDTAALVHQLVLDTEMENRMVLRSLYSGLESTQESLAVSTLKCRKAEHVFIVLHPTQTADCLFSLLDLKTLKELHIREETDDEIDCESGLMMEPVLARHGETLLSLNIAECHHIDVSLLSHSCPSLIHLVLLWNKSYVSSDQREKRPFCCLKTVNLAFLTQEDEDNISRREMSSSELSLILSSPALQSLKVAHSRNLTDLSLSSKYSFNSLMNLRNMEIEHCHNISFDGLEHILEDLNSLESVRLIKCEQITNRDIQKYQRKVKKLKWNIKIEWS